MNSNILVGAFIADVHIDAADSDMVYCQLKEYFIKELEKLPVLDLIVIGGDFFDSKIPLESRAAKLANRFFNKDLVNIMRKKDCAVRVIKGTESHDNDQLDNFLHLQEDETIDFKVCSKVMNEYFRGFNFLYIPEEYLKNPIKYYEYYMQQDYDMAFGHGMFKKVSFTDNNATVMKDAPVFSNDFFRENVKGPVLFGHIHTPTKVNSQVRYPGSFHAWKMGEETKKGFFIFIYNKTTGKYLILPSYNNGTKKYITINIDSYLKYPVEYIIKTLNNTVEDEKVQKLRVDITYDGNNSNKLTNISIIKEYYQGNKRVIINYKNIKLKKSEEAKKEVLNEYSYLFDKSSRIEDNISKFIASNFDEKIDSETVLKVLNEEI